MSDRTWIVWPERDDDPGHLALLYDDEEWAAIMAGLDEDEEEGDDHGSYSSTSNHQK